MYTIEIPFDEVPIFLKVYHPVEHVVEVGYFSGYAEIDREGAIVGIWLEGWTDDPARGSVKTRAELPHSHALYPLLVDAIANTHKHVIDDTLIEARYDEKATIAELQWEHDYHSR